MRLLFRQRFFSWFDSYDIYDERENPVYTVKGQLSWGHCLKIFNRDDREVGTVKEKIFTFLPKFELYENEQYLGCISKEFTFLCLITTLILMDGRWKETFWNGIIRSMMRPADWWLRFPRNYFT